MSPLWVNGLEMYQLNLLCHTGVLILAGVRREHILGQDNLVSVTVDYLSGSFHGLCLLRENVPSLADSPPHSTLAAGPNETENSASPGGILASLNHETCSRASSCHSEPRVRFANTGLLAYLFLSTWRHCYG